MHKKFPSLTFISLLLFAYSTIYGQNQQNLDSLLISLEENITDRKRVETYIKIAREYNNEDSINTLKYSNKAIALANKIGYIQGSIDALYPTGVINVKKGHFKKADSLFTKMLKSSVVNKYSKGEAKALYGLGRLNAHLGKNNEGLKYFLKSLKIQEGINEIKSIALNYNMIGLIYMRKNHYDEALEYFLKSLKINEELSQLLEMGNNYNNIGIIYKNQGNIDKAIDYYNKSLEINKRIEREDFIASNKANIGNLFYIKGDYEQALEYHLETIALRQKIGNKRDIAYGYMDIAPIYSGLKDYQQALSYLSKSLKILNDINFEGDKNIALISMGKIYNELNQLDVAKKHLENGLQIAQTKGILKSIRDGAEQLAIVNQKLGNYKEAYQAHVLFKEMTDSLNNKETVQKITRLELEYEFNKEKESIKSIQQKELFFLEEKSKRVEFRNISIAICILLLLITGLVIYDSVSKSKRSKELNSFRDHISQDLHDEIGSTLSSISLYGTVASKNIIDNPERTNQLLSRINSSAIQSIESINDIVWAIKSENDTLVSLTNRMRSFANEIQDTGEWQIEFSHSNNSMQPTLNMIQRRNTYLIFKEAINNAVKYSNGNYITIDISAADSIFILAIKDNGIGFDPKHSSKQNMFGGNGLNNMKNRAEELNGTLKIISSLDNGTNIILNYII